MDRSRRSGAKEAAPTTPPNASRLTIKPRRNRRRQGSLWSRMPKPPQIANACGRALRRSLPALPGLGGLSTAHTTGHPFKHAADDDVAGLPVITGLDRTAYAADPERSARMVRDALAALDQWQASDSRPAIGELHIDPHGALAL